tara:strand:- start:1053 stop:1664 length:612 start_codon:yes stop_codon:yes gene_type:complete
MDIGFRCTLECPGCSRQRDYKDVRPVPGRDTTISEWEILTDFFDEIQCCGQISDPIFNPYLLEFFKIAKRKGTYLLINTAASHKPEKWYNEAFDTFGPGEWIFGIDGLPNESHKYRINQDGEKLFEMAKLCAKKGITTRWQYIIFKYNENHIEQARQMAKDNGIIFEISTSARFEGPDDPYRPTNSYHYIDPTQFAFVRKLNV